MTAYQVNPIGTVLNDENGPFIKLDATFIPALEALNGFGYINVLWWCSDFDDDRFRSVLQAEKPYKKGPEKIGIFATRSPFRPNPVALTAAEVLHIDYENGIIQIAYIDAHDGTPVLDIKPYTPSYDRVETPAVPGWCSHWPGSIEQSSTFAWENEFNFPE